jgi:hypothetical protein
MSSLQDSMVGRMKTMIDAAQSIHEEIRALDKSLAPDAWHGEEPLSHTALHAFAAEHGEKVMAVVGATRDARPKILSAFPAELRPRVLAVAMHLLEETVNSMSALVVSCSLTEDPRIVVARYTRLLHGVDLQQ